MAVGGSTPTYRDEGIRSMEEALTEYHLKYLLEDTFDAQTKWRFIGLYLGLTPPMLSAIKTNNPSSEEWYTEVLTRWINTGSATLKKLIHALEANTVKENAIATRLRLKYAKKNSPQEAVKPSSSHEEASNVEPREVTQEDAGVQGVVVDTRETGDTTQDLLTEYERGVLEKCKIFRKRFYELEDKAIELAKAKGWTPDTFSSLLSRLPLKYRDDHVMFLKEEIPRFLKATTIKEIFSYLDLYWSFLSTDLLEYIIDQLGDVESKRQLKQLNAEVAEFRKMTPLNVYWKVEEIDPASRPVPNAELWQLVTDHKPNSLSGSSTLDEVEKFRKQFANAFTIDKVALCISKISPGSLRIVWIIPPSVAPLLDTDIKTHPERLEMLGLNSATVCPMPLSSGGEEINKDNLPHIVDLLRPIAKKWKQIGRALLVKVQVLDDLQNNPELVEQGPEAVLRETLKAAQTLTLKTLANVLRSPSVHEENAASLLEETYLVTKGTSAVNKEMTTLAQSFHALKMSVSKQLDSMNTPVKELHEVVVSLYPYAAIPKSLMARLEGAANCQDYFTIITIHGMWNYINHHLLECIVEKLIPRDNDMRKAIALHGSNVTEFAAKTHIDDYIDVCSRKLSETLVVEHAIPHPTMFIPFQLQLEPSIQRKCLHSVLTLQNHLMKHFSLPHPTLMLGSVGRGSTVIVFQFPQVEMERVCSVANTSSGFFRDLNVESVTIGNQFQYSQNTSVPTSQEARGDELQDSFNYGQFPGEKAPRVHHIENLSELEQRLFYTRVLCTHFNFLYQHLDTPAILNTLHERGLITTVTFGAIKMLSEKYAQNARAIQNMQMITAPPNCAEKLCEILDQNHVAKVIYSEYVTLAMYGYPQPTKNTYASTTEHSMFGRLSSAFLKMLIDVIDTFDKYPHSLDRVKQLLGHLVLPMDGNEVVPVIDPNIYKDADLVRQLFRLLSPLLNCFSTDLIQYLSEESHLASDAVEEFCQVRWQHSDSILCTRKNDESEVNDLNTACLSAPLSPGHFKVHTISLDELQSLHPLVFTRLDYHRTTPFPQTTRLSVEVDRPQLTLQDYDSITNAISTAFLLPKIAMVYAGCSMTPIVLTWLVPAQLERYIKDSTIGATTCGNRLLAEQRVVSVAIGDDLRIACLGMQEVRLREAAFYGLDVWVQKLIQCNTNTTAADTHGFCVLQTASQNNHIAVVRTLLKCGKKKMVPRKASLQSTSHSQVITDAGVDINQQDRWGQTAIYCASAQGHSEVVKLLVQAEADLELSFKDSQCTPLIISAYKGYTEVVKVLLEAGANVNSQDKFGETAVYFASIEGYSAIVRLLVQAGADLELPLKEALMTPLIVASDRGHSEVVALLLEAGVNINHQDKWDQTALYYAAARGHSKVVELLVHSGADLEVQRTDSQSTALTISSERGHTEVVKVLLEAGANINYQTKWTETALYSTSALGHTEIVKLLVHAGANLELQKEGQITPLLISSDRGHSDVVRVLLEAGADINHQDKSKNTALTLAAAWGHTDVVQVLLSQQDLNIGLRNKDGHTAADLALSKGYTEIHQMITYHTFS